MFEVKVTITAPELEAAINNLAAAMARGGIVNGIKENTPVTSVQVNQPAAPVAPIHPTPAAGVPLSAAPARTEAPAANVPAPAAIPTSAPTYSIDMLATAGTALVDAGKMNELLALLGEYGVEAVTQLKPEQYGTFATELRALGAQI